MIARGPDHRRRPPTVTLEMTLEEFREHTEWLEELSPHDGCTRDWRATLDRIDPPQADEEPQDPSKQHCPDGGACHHACTDLCFRVACCEPLTAAGWGSAWPPDIDPRPRPGVAKT